MYLGAFCAMRLGEICALESTDITGNVITINKSLALCEDGSYKIKQPKTFSSYRTVHAPDFVIQRLSGIDGRILNMKPYNVTKALKRALKKNNLPDFRFHDLRHPYVKSTTKNKLAAKAEIPNYQHEFNGLRFLLFYLDVQSAHDKKKPYSSNVTYVS